jgi:hypothetical protein
MQESILQQIHFLSYSLIQLINQQQNYHLKANYSPLLYRKRVEPCLYMGMGEEEALRLEPLLIRKGLRMTDL